MAFYGTLLAFIGNIKLLSEATQEETIEARIQTGDDGQYIIANIKENCPQDIESAKVLRTIKKFLDQGPEVDDFNKASVWVALQIPETYEHLERMADVSFGSAEWEEALTELIIKVNADNENWENEQDEALKDPTP